MLGAAINGRRDGVLISTKTGLPTGSGPNDAGTSRARLVRAVDDALRRLDTDYIDLLQLHAFDASTPAEEVMSTLDDLVRAGKLRYIGVSNFAGWQNHEVAGCGRSARLVALRGEPGLLLARRPRLRVGPDAARRRPGAGALVWAPLGWGRLTGKIRRNTPLPEGSRLHETAGFGPPVDDARLYDVVDALDAIAEETGKTVPQIALNWLLQRRRCRR